MSPTRTLDRDKLVAELKLISPDAGTSLRLHEAVVAPPAVNLSIDGASTLSIQVADHDRRLASSDAFVTRSWAQACGMNFELVKAAKSGHIVTLTFEDAIAGALRREKKKRKWPANSATRREIIMQLAKGAEVKTRVDPDKRPKVRNVVERGPDANAWDLTGTLASEIQWRRFSNGKRLIVGGDEWLLERDDDVTRITENVGPWGSVDYDLDAGKRASTATVDVDAELGALMPGDVVRIVDDYPATDGKWLVGGYEFKLTTPRATLSLVRQQHTLKEPKGNGSGSDGETGDPNFLPDVEGDPGQAGTSETATTSASNPARERMVQFALAQAGDAYVWGGNGPSGWDCSGLVQGATAAAGKTLGKPAASQWSTCQSAGVTIPVAEALRIRGALLFRIGTGTYNHVAISLGNGSTIEAMGSAYGVLVAGNAAGRGWTGAALWI